MSLTFEDSIGHLDLTIFCVLVYACVHLRMFVYNLLKNCTTKTPIGSKYHLIHTYMITELEINASRRLQPILKEIYFEYRGHKSVHLPIYSSGLNPIDQDTNFA
ncbi:hypothetical protein PHYBLDRAFT_65245 [Phycomyces blakesleeanus NRRL 1555(-)]|uniref:Uncharacterized protein n=1 Tax=Phycomyces blakesleeanus (strain ATCC 8743b / DSM 1359 / FGSC 10004 / NBRC 33097 / NRRL 1555) TaxID=763407 RepID=A0A163AE10_PHYB8|nr:hypothetical protein PHYBLDRAFT_65245 [Phycomyces blakesleeanus NRRL 1555(-)]OAD72831.1 hypothetical protein PHYBLDRAFT_65245 [Phycomyces blakesleeanus NRRL 1555(-)]|eukprot:XP_018290871.1 hypothetical protein PHYBLDRAFT_65245 [Phycomyces blakesleeanus NRRL 1555(-)]